MRDSVTKKIRLSSGMIVPLLFGLYMNVHPKTYIYTNVHTQSAIFKEKVGFCVDMVAHVCELHHSDGRSRKIECPGSA